MRMTQTGIPYGCQRSLTPAQRAAIWEARFRPMPHRHPKPGLARHMLVVQGVDFAHDPADLAITHETIGLVRRAVARLPKRERRVLVSRVFHHKKLKEVGERMKITTERVRQIQQRAIRLLRDDPYLIWKVLDD